MKNLILILVLIFVSKIAFSQETPGYLKDSKITVVLKNGKSYTFDPKEYAVVPRKPKSQIKIPVIAPVAEKEDPAPKPAPELPYYKNRIGLLLGYGLNGQMTDSRGSSTIDVEQKKGAVGGIILQRDLNREYHIMGSILTNETLLLGVGKGF